MEAPKEEVQLFKEPAENKSSGGSAFKIIGILIVIVVLAGAAAGAFFLYKRFAEADPQKMQEKINAELKEKGINVNTEISRDWQATLSGTAQNRVEKETALSIVKAHKEIKNVQDNVEIGMQQSGPSDGAEKINSALKKEGINEITAQADQNNGLVLRGNARNEAEKENALRIAREAAGSGPLRDEIQMGTAVTEQPRGSDTSQKQTGQTYRPGRTERPRAERRFRDEGPGRFDDGGMGPFRLESEINRALRDAGIRDITAQVNSNMGVVLRGYAYGYNEKDRAIRIAESFREARRVIDRISVDR
jgi:osmotically-inducible protein OsmY